MDAAILFFPEIILLVMTVLLLCLSLAKNEWRPETVQRCMLVGTGLLLAGCFYALPAAGSPFQGTYRVDLLSQGFKTLIGAGLFFTVVLSRDLLSVSPRRAVEYFIFLCTGTLGMMMLASAADLLVLYVSMELSSYSLYLLTALRKDRKNAEAAVKYLIFGAATSGVFLWGLSFMLGLSGTASLEVISANIGTLAAQPAFLLGLVFLSFAFFFKLSSFPFHFWAPDVYESAATPVTHFIATASKAAAVAVLVRVLAWTGVPAAFVTWLGILGFLSMTLGNAAALMQKDVKRLLAYSSVAQAGYILVGLLSGTPEGFSSSFFYAVAYLLMNAAVFTVVVSVAKAERHDNPLLSHFDGLAERSPFLALLLLLGLLSLAGIPPLVGFTGKWILFSAAMGRGHWFLVLWAVLNSVVSLFYYLTLVKHAYLEKPQNPAPIVLTVSTRFLGSFLFGAMVLLGVFPGALITFAQQAVSAIVR